MKTIKEILEKLNINDTSLGSAFKDPKEFLEYVLKCKLVSPSLMFSASKQIYGTSYCINKDKNDGIRISILKDNTMTFTLKGYPIDFIDKKIGFDNPDYTIEDLESIKEDFVKAMKYLIANSRCPNFSNWEQTTKY